MAGHNRTANKKNAIRMDAGTKVFDIIAIMIVLAAAIVCVLQFVLMLSGSFSSEADIIIDGYSLWPKTFLLLTPITLYSPRWGVRSRALIWLRFMLRRWGRFWDCLRHR